MKSPWVRVVIVNYNGSPWLQDAVDALSRQTASDFEAVIVDNASTDGSFQSLHLPDGRFSAVSAGGNLGFAQGCNLGAVGCSAPYLAMLNPDAIAEPDWLEQLGKAAERHPHAVCIGSTQLEFGTDRLDGAGDNYSIFGIAWRGGFGSRQIPDTDIPVLSACAAAALYRRDAFEAVGGFEPSFFCYLEDVDLGFRLHLNGGQIIQAASPRVHHVGSASTGRHSDFTMRHSARNGIWLMARCLPRPLFALAFPLYLAATLYLCLRMPATAAARLGGVMQGIWGLGRAWTQGRMIQEKRRVDLFQVASWLAWNPATVSRREIFPLSRTPG